MKPNTIDHSIFNSSLLPIILGSAAMIYLVGSYQISAIEKTYQISGTTVESLSNSMQTLSSLTEEPYHDLVAMAANQPEEMGDATALDGFNQILQEKNAYLLVRKSDTVIYVGTDMKEAGNVISELPEYGGAETTSENGIYLGGDAQALVKQVDSCSRTEVRQCVLLYLISARQSRRPENF